MAKVSRQVRRATIRNNAKYGTQNAQMAINHTLWKIVMENGGMLNIPVSTMQGIPNNAALEVKVDSATSNLIIVAGSKESKNGLWMPN